MEGLGSARRISIDCMPVSGPTDTFWLSKGIAPTLSRDKWVDLLDADVPGQRVTLAGALNLQRFRRWKWIANGNERSGDTKNEQDYKKEPTLCGHKVRAA
jgi:hypothetical protein